MNKQELIKLMAENADMTQTAAAKALDAFEYAVGSTLQMGDELKLVGFGTFKATQQPARIARNPSTGEPVEVPAKKRISFIAGKGLKEIVNLD